MAVSAIATQKPPLWTRNYVFACIGNILCYFGFCMLLPILPIFLMEKFNILQAQTGIILAAHTFCAMLARPLFAYLSDLYNRKLIFCIVLLAYGFLFLPYPFIPASVAAIMILRALHGFSFGGEAVCGNAILIDIVHEKRRGEGFGYFGITNNIGMALGPMVGLFVYESVKNGFLWIFLVAFALCMVGFVFILQVHPPKNPESAKITPEKRKITFDKFFQVKGAYAGLCLLFLSFPYGLIMSFSAMYGREIGVGGKTGLFFACMSAGLIFSRIFAGRAIDRGKLTGVIKLAAFLICASLAMFAANGFMAFSPAVSSAIFYACGLFFGLGYGVIFPAFNTLFVNLSPDNRRAAASSTYLTSWDAGLGTGLILGGFIMEKSDMHVAYAVAAVSVFVSALYFTFFVAGHFGRNRLR